MTQRLSREELPRLYAAIAQVADLFLPVKRAGKTNFALWNTQTEVDLDTLKTAKSPKDLFFPQCEPLYTCDWREGNLTVTAQALAERDFVVFGVRGCDLRGLDVLDRVFLSDPVDSFYAARREHGTVIAFACREPEESCFCRTFGVDCAEPGGDVTVWLTDGTLYWRANTPKGQALTDRLDLLGKTDDADEQRLAAEQTAAREIIDRLPYANLFLDGWNGDATEARFASPLWEKLYRPCLACGACTFACPTCQCYDIRDYDTGNGVQRFRCWDSCMYSDFTMMAHGNNRTSQMQRFRQRFMHKLVYFPANNDGMYSCVGCGRCVEQCPSGLNIVKVIKAFEKEAKK